MKDYIIEELCPIPISIRNGCSSSGEVLISRDQRIPWFNTFYGVTTFNNQYDAEFDFYEGDEMNEQNFITRFTIKNLPRRPAGEVTFMIFYNCDENAMLDIYAKVAYPEGVEMEGYAKCSLLLNAERNERSISSTSCSCKDCK